MKHNELYNRNYFTTSNTACFETKLICDVDLCEHLISMLESVDCHGSNVRSGLIDALDHTIKNGNDIDLFEDLLDEIVNYVNGICVEGLEFDIHGYCSNNGDVYEVLFLSESTEQTEDSEATKKQIEELLELL